jgi:nicotinamidase-related amidase
MRKIENAVHLCIDMQRIFRKGGIWETPWMERVLPNVAEIASRYRERTIFTRFITPASPEHAEGQWRSYYERWRCATRGSLDPIELELVPELARYAPPARVLDKSAYSAFFRSPLLADLLERQVRTVVVSGAETDVCVLSTVLDAVNIGLRVVLVEDAVCSSSDAGHDALMTMYRLRYAQQIDLVNADILPEYWPRAV